MQSEILDYIFHLMPTSWEDFVADLNWTITGPSIKSTFVSLLNILYKDNKLKQWQACLDIGKEGESIQSLLDITWEMLNIGHWKDVDITWRRLYAQASLFKAISVLSKTDFCLKDIVETCDNGLLMGCPIFNNILSKIAYRVSKEVVIEDYSPIVNYSSAKKKKLFHSPTLSETHKVVEDSCPSIEKFLKDYKMTKSPVVLKNVVDHWPAFSTSKWSVDHLVKVIGCRTVPVELGSKYTDESWSQKLMTVSEFVKIYVSNSDPPSVAYLAQHELFGQIPELLEDIGIPEYCMLGEQEANINSWFGPEGTVSPLHFDPKDNLLTQVFGEKYIRLYAESATASVYPHESELLNNTSQVDVENPDPEKFPLFVDAPYRECILRAGEMLYIPAKYWHYVRSLSPSFSISFWWS